MSTIKDWELKSNLYHNLSDELGNGDSKRVHVKILLRFLDDLYKGLWVVTLKLN